MVSKVAISLLALLGSAAAQYSNSSTTASPTTSSAGLTYTNNAEPSVGGVTFLVQTDTSATGTILNLRRKRDSNAGLKQCLDTCAASSACVATQFVRDTGVCQYFSSIDSGSQQDTPGTDFALVQERITDNNTSSVFNGTTPATSNTASATRTPGIPVGGNNSTSATRSGTATRSSSTGSSTSSSAPISTPSSIITYNGVIFLLEININYPGSITIEFAILSKRAGETLDQCLATCAANTACAGTSFEDGTCTFYSSVDEGSQVVDEGVTFATVLARPGSGNGGGNNGTTPGSSSNATAESLICPAYNGGVITSNVNVTFAVSCGQFLIGTTYDALAEIRSKRQAIDTGLPSTISNCIDLCSVAESCVGVTFEIATETCSYYSDVRYSQALAGYDSATRVEDNNGDGGEIVTITTSANGAVTTTTATVYPPTSTVYVGATSTAIVYTTVVSTVTVIAGGATALPTGAVVTEVVPTSTITYVQTVSTITLPQGYAAPTVTITVGGAGAPVVTQSVTVTVDANGNVIGSSTAGAVAGNGAGGAGAGAGAAYPTVTVHDTVTVCPTPEAAQNIVWTTIYT